MKTQMLSGKVVKNFLQGNKGHHSRPHHRVIMSSKIKGTDASNLRPLENAPYQPSYRSDVAVKGRSLDDKVPGNLRDAAPMFAISTPIIVFLIVLAAYVAMRR